MPYRNEPEFGIIYEPKAHFEKIIPKMGRCFRFFGHTKKAALWDSLFAFNWIFSTCE